MYNTYDMCNCFTVKVSVSKFKVEKSENLENAFYVFLRFFTFFYVFFDMTLQKRKKARFFGF